MPTAYTLRVYDEAGALQAIVTDFLTLQYRRAVNEPGMLTFSLTDAHELVGAMSRDWQVEVWRSRTADPDEDNAITAYRDFDGLVRVEERRADSNGQTLVAWTAPGAVDILRRPIVAYPADTANRSAFTATPAETIAKTLVTYNATTSGTTGDGRDRSVPTVGTYVTVETDGANGPDLDVFCARRNLLDVLQEIAAVGDGDFDLVKTAARSWQFRWYNGQLGTDRSASVVFALQYGNMSSPVLRRDWLAEATVAIVAGQGTNEDRVVSVRTGTNYDASVGNTEILVDARDVSTADGLAGRGDARLEILRAKDNLQFDVIQTPGSLYGRDYFLGDLVTGYYQGITATKQIRAVTVTLSNTGDESIAVELTDA